MTFVRVNVTFAATDFISLMHIGRTPYWWLWIRMRPLENVAPFKNTPYKDRKCVPVLITPLRSSQQFSFFIICSHAKWFSISTWNQVYKRLKNDFTFFKWKVHTQLHRCSSQIRHTSWEPCPFFYCYDWTHSAIQHCHHHTLPYDRQFEYKCRFHRNHPKQPQCDGQFRLKEEFFIKFWNCAGMTRNVLEQMVW